MKISQITNDIVEDVVSLEKSLTRTSILAIKINDNALSKWIELELNGYSIDNKLPEYRKGYCDKLIYSGINGSYQVKNTPLPLSCFNNETKEKIRDIKIFDGIKVIEKLISNKDEIARDLTCLSDTVNDATNGQIQCTSIKQLISKSIFIKVYSSVKKLLLDKIIEIQRIHGDIDNMGDIEILSEKEQIQIDINMCKKLIENPIESELRDFYRQFTAKYIEEIPDLGTNIYSYYPEQKFFDSEILVETIIGNIKVMLPKVLKYYSKKYCANAKGDNEIILKTNNIFIIHGHNEAKKLELCKLIKEEFHLNPILLSEQPTEGATIIEKFERYAKQCSFAFALFTPDDIVKDGDKEYFQTRPNVIFELGWFVAHFNRKNVCILNQAKKGTEIFSDLHGVGRIEFISDIREKFLDIRDELCAAGLLQK